MIDLPNNDPLRHAQTLLGQSAVFDLKDVSVDRLGDCLVLVGRVQSFYAKQLAQETIRPAADGLRVVNRVEVR